MYVAARALMLEESSRFVHDASAEPWSDALQGLLRYDDSLRLGSWLDASIIVCDYNHELLLRQALSFLEMRWIHSSWA